MKRLWLFLGGWGLVCQPALAVHYYITADVPAELTGVGTTLPWHIARGDTVTGTYEPALSLPPGTAVDGLHQMGSGDWLLSVEAPADLGGTTFLPQDVALHDPATGTFLPFFCGGPAGVPAGVNVDALFLEAGGTSSLVLGFDVPATIGTETYDPADLVRYISTGPGCADWAFAGVYFEASLASPPVPPSSNVTAADTRLGRLILSFDVPTSLGAAVFLPGDLVSWTPCPPDDGCISPWFLAGLFHGDPGWPIAARLDGFAFLAASLAGPGGVPPTIRVGPGAPDGSTVVVSWDASCSAGAEDYTIYEGTIGSWYSHTAIDCNDDGTPLTETVATSPGNTYYLVVPTNPDGEGSYGTDSGGGERPRGTGTCTAARVIGPCP